jgi:hypothetical protein
LFPLLVRQSHERNLALLNLGLMKKPSDPIAVTIAANEAPGSLSHGGMFDVFIIFVPVNAPPPLQFLSKRHQALNVLRFRGRLRLECVL